MEEVRKMSGLRRLEVKCAQNVEYPDLPLQLEELSLNYGTENQLRCVERMPRLRSLEVINYLGPNLTFPHSQHNRLMWLYVGFNTDHKPTMLSLIRAYASSVQELRVFCTLPTGDKDFYFPDLGQELAACRLVALRRLVLVRPMEYRCTDNASSCVLQRRTIRSVFPHSVDVVCRSCHSPEF
ncbi:uncharacterized protein LOC113209390 [Frankliniella occidentalis]|uniref:Uncharacterized protein LOC113209390 n=1 Tax=Frankliniella occidentalis TaxID=133901 RepID=A0A9C6XAR2_FRAOC|nr:uncharacterized protein LOC113209390 [Frankliniella occidentalis]